MSIELNEAFEEVADCARELRNDARRMRRFLKMIRRHRLADSSVGALLAEATIEADLARTILAAVVAPEANISKTPPFAMWFTCWVPPMRDQDAHWPLLLAALSCFPANSITRFLIDGIVSADSLGERSSVIAALFGTHGQLSRAPLLDKTPPPADEEASE